MVEILSVDQVAERLRERVAIEGARKSYRQNLESMYRVHISPALGNRMIGAVLTEDVERLASRMLARGASPKTVRNVMTFLHSVFGLAVRKGWVPSNPVQDAARQGWLFRTAQREAWRLTAIRRSELRLRSEVPDRGLTDPDRSADPARRLEQRQQFEEAIFELKQIPKPMQAVVLVASQVRRHRDVGEILDIPETRVGYLLASASAALGEAAERRAERERPVASPRAARLRELEDAPPDWLVESVGRPPARGKNASASILAWRRAALAIDDYRHDHAWTSPYEGLGPKPTDNLIARRAHERAQLAIERVSVERARRRGDALER